jgi:hypothetical protein
VKMQRNREKMGNVTRYTSILRIANCAVQNSVEFWVFNGSLGSNVYGRKTCGSGGCTLGC